MKSKCKSTGAEEKARRRVWKAVTLAGDDKPETTSTFS